MLYFKATLEDNRVKLRWATSLEENFQKFIVERSSDGTTSSTIAEVQGQGKNIYETETKYNFVDDQPALGFNCYRLKAVGLDDSFEISETRGCES